MPPDDDKAQIEAMRLMIGGALQQMGRDLESMSKKAKDSSADGSGLKGLDSLITGMTRNLQGPLGLGAAIISVSKSLETFAANRLQMRNFSTDVGASVPLINAMSLAMEKAGITAEESKASILTLGTTIQDLAARGMGSELATLLRNTGHPVNDIQKLIETSRTNMDKAITDTIQILNRGNDQVRSYRARELHIAESHLQAMQRTQEEMNKVYQSNLEAAKKWHEGWVERSLQISNTWKWLKDQFIQTFEGGAEERQKIIDQYFPAGGKGGADPKNPDWLNRILHPMENKQWPFPGSPSLSNILTPPAGAREGQPNFNERFGNWPGQDRATDFSGRRRTEELIEVERNSNKSLLDIRDILQRMENGGEGEHAGGAPGGGRRALGRMLGIDAGGALGGGGTRGDRNNNPGNMKMSPLARAFGAVGADDQGFAIFPDKLSGSEAQSALVKSDRYKGLTLDQFGNRYSEGSADWKKTVGKELGIGTNDIVNNQDPRLLDAIRKAEGTGRAPGISREALAGVGRGGNLDPSAMDPMARAGSGLESDTSVVTSPGGARFRVKSEFAPNFQRFINSYEQAGGVIGKNSGGLAGRAGNASYHPLGRAIDVNQVGYGVRGGGRSLPRELEEQLAEEAGLYPGSKFRRRSDIGHFEVRNRSLALLKQREWTDSASAREQIDKTQSVSQRVDANMNASVDFRNMPSWVKSSVDSNGKFKELRVTRSTPQAGKASSPQSDLQNWSYE